MADVMLAACSVSGVYLCGTMGGILGLAQRLRLSCSKRGLDSLRTITAKYAMCNGRVTGSEDRTNYTTQRLVRGCPVQALQIKRCREQRRVYVVFVEPRSSTIPEQGLELLMCN